MQNGLSIVTDWQTTVYVTGRVADKNTCGNAKDTFNGNTPNCALNNRMNAIIY